MFDFVFSFFKGRGLSGTLLNAASSLVVSVVIVLSVLVIGYIVNRLEYLQMRLLSLVFKSKTVFVICNYLTFAGVVIHELSHALVAWLTGAKVTEIRLFEIDGTGQLGHVNFNTSGSRLQQHCQLVFTSCAPVIIGGLLSYGLITLISVCSLPFGVNVLTIYLLISVIDHMSMSGADIKCYFRGLIFVYPVVFVICWLIFFFR